MDYNLKKENRKKFQDKSKLKRHHKKDYSKVVREESQIEEIQERIREFDIEGNPILFDDEELDLDGNIVIKGTTNDFRYKESLVDVDQVDLNDYEVDFKKNLNNDKLLEKEKDFKEMKTEDLLKINIIDKEFDNENINEEFIFEGNKKLPKEENTKNSFIPKSLKSDEDFLDDLL